MSARCFVLALSMAMALTTGAWARTPADLVASGIPVLGAVEHVTRALEHRGPTRVVVGAEGTATAVWAEDYGTSGRRHLYRIRAAQRSPGGVWSTPRTIGCPRGSACTRTYPVVGVAGSGRVTAAWAVRARVFVRSWTDGAGWGRPTLISVETRAVWPKSVDLAVAPNGAAVLAWSFADENPPVRVARRPAHRPWTAPKGLGAGYGPTVAAAGSGLAVVAFDDGAAELSARRFVPGRGWSRRHWFGTWPSLLGDVAIGPHGRVLIVWGNGLGQDACCRIKGREISPSGRWGRSFVIAAPVALTDLDFWPTPVAHIDSHGTETVAWVHWPGGATYTGVAARRRAGGSWTYRLFPSATGVVQLVANRAGDLALAFSNQIRLRHHGDRWSAAAPVNGRIGILPGGAAIRMWWEDPHLNAQTVRQQ